jgi:hypothetical protein
MSRRSAIVRIQRSATQDCFASLFSWLAISVLKKFPCPVCVRFRPFHPPPLLTPHPFYPILNANEKESAAENRAKAAKGCSPILGGMRRAFAFGSLALLAVTMATVTAGWLWWRSEVNRLKTPKSVIEETGLRLPSDARIAATRAHLFSFVDRNNYEWLIQSDTSLLQWVTTNMAVERGGWEHIRNLAELGDFENQAFTNAKFGGVWKGVHNTSQGRQETSYMYLAEDGRVGILSTFSP